MVVAEAPGTDTPILTKSFYSPTEVARLASVSNSTILNYIRSEKLAAVRLSARVYRIPRKSVMLLLGLPTTRQSSSRATLMQTCAWSSATVQFTDATYLRTADSRLHRMARHLEHWGEVGPRPRSNRGHRSSTSSWLRPAATWQREARAFYREYYRPRPIGRIGSW